MGAITKIVNGESGTTVANKLWAINKFDYVVESQADMDALIAYSDGGYNDILIKDGSYTVSVNATLDTLDGSLLGTNTTLTFEQGAVLRFTGNVWPDALNRSIIKNFEGMYNPVINFESTDIDMDVIDVFKNCNNIHNLKVTFANIDFEANDSALFNTCNNIYNPSISITGATDANLPSINCAIMKSCDSIISPKIYDIGYFNYVEGWFTYSDCTNILFPSLTTLGESTSYDGTNTGVLAVVLA